MAVVAAGGDVQAACAFAAGQGHDVAAGFTAPHVRQRAALNAGDMNVLAQRGLCHAVFAHQFHHAAQHRVTAVALIEKPAAITGCHEQRQEYECQYPD